MRVRIGCSGWGYDDWRGRFYAPGAQPGEYLAAYARAFRFVEVDSTFYRAPSVLDAERWARVTPEDFLFSPKVPRAITHDQKLRGAQRQVDAFVDALRPLARAKKLGPCLLQLPPSFRDERDREALVDFLAGWPRSASLAVELRDASWWREETYATLRAHGAILCWSLNEHGRTPPVLTADAVYARLIGDRSLDAKGGVWDRVQRDMRPEVERLREDLATAYSQARESFLVANNHFMGFAPESCRLLAQALGEPEPDLGLAARPRAQRGLGEFAG